MQATWEMGGKGYGWEDLEGPPLPDPYKGEWASDSEDDESDDGDDARGGGGREGWTPWGEAARAGREFPGRLTREAVEEAREPGMTDFGENSETPAPRAPPSLPLLVLKTTRPLRLTHFLRPFAPLLPLSRHGRRSWSSRRGERCSTKKSSGLSWPGSG